MLIPLPEVLQLPSFRSAETRVLAGDPATTLVRWVHSSEVYEMGSLLAGGEVLLTTGLGLHGRTAEQLTAYVDQVADAGCVALGLEIGRSFFTVPDALVAASRRRNLVLLALGSVVPFEQMIEDFHELVVERRLELGDDGGIRAFLELVVIGAGLRALLDQVSRAAGAVAEYLDSEGRLVERSRIRTPAAGSETTVATVRGPLGALGSVVLGAPEDGLRRRVAEQAALAVALELGRHPDLGRRPSLSQSLITDLHAGVLVSRGDVVRRLAEAGLRLGTGQHLVVVAVDAGSRISAADVLGHVEECWPQLTGPVIAGAVGSHVLVVLPGWGSAAPDRVRAVLHTAADRLGTALPASGVMVGVAVPTTDPAHLPEQVAEARAVVRTAQRHGLSPAVVMARDVGVQQLLSSGIEPSRLSAFVAEQIGPLIDHDRRYAADLIRTLDAFLSVGLSKTAAAAALGIRRQSLYARLDRIERLLGVSLEDPGQRSGLDLALIAWRMRTGLDPQAAFEGLRERGRAATPAP